MVAPNQYPGSIGRFRPTSYGVMLGSDMGTYIQVLMQFDQARVVLSALDSLREASLYSKRKSFQFESVSRGLYEELEKLCIRTPNDLIAPQFLEIINCLIMEATPLMRGRDDFIRFIQAFDCVPTHREAVFTLRNLRQGLERFIFNLNVRMEEIDSRTEQVRAIFGALTIAKGMKEFNGNRVNGRVLRRDVEESGIFAHPDWFRNNQNNLSDFNFTRLNTTDIIECFLRDLMGDFLDDFLADLS